MDKFTKCLNILPSKIFHFKSDWPKGQIKLGELKNELDFLVMREKENELSKEEPQWPDDKKDEESNEFGEEYKAKRKEIRERAKS